MPDQFRTPRRDFLANALTTAGTAAFTLGLGHAEAQEADASHASGGSPVSPDGLYDTSIRATTLKGEAADRLALRRLVDAWAHCADRRLAEAQANLFTPDGVILNYEGDPDTHPPHSTIRGRAAIQTALAVLRAFSVTLHMNGQSDVVIHGESALGETYCIVHQFTEKDGQRVCQTLGIRYRDQFLRQQGCWYFAERRVIIDWSDSRPSVP